MVTCPRVIPFALYDYRSFPDRRIGCWFCQRSRIHIFRTALWLIVPPLWRFLYSSSRRLRRSSAHGTYSGHVAWHPSWRFGATHPLHGQSLFLFLFHSEIMFCTSSVCPLGHVVRAEHGSFIAVQRQHHCQQLEQITLSALVAVVHTLPAFHLGGIYQFPEIFLLDYNIV